MKEKKSSAFKNAITILISVAVAGVFLWVALRGLDVDKIKNSLQKANYLWVLFAAVFGISAYIFWAVRWNLLLEPMGYKISNSNSLWSISFGYLMNLTIPRSGEVARSTALYGVEKVPVDKSFGTIILERFVDLVCMGIFALLTLIFKYDALIAFYKSATEQKNQAAPQSDSNMSYIVLGFIVFLVILLFIFKTSTKIIHLQQNCWVWKRYFRRSEIHSKTSSKRKIHSSDCRNLDLLFLCIIFSLLLTSGNLRFYSR